MLRSTSVTFVTAACVCFAIAGCSKGPVAPDSSRGSAGTLTASPDGNGTAASPNAATRDTAGVFPFAGGPDIAGASSTLVRNDGGVTMTIHTSGLVPGNAYTVWWIVFNNPAACEGGCGLDDLTRPDVRASLVYATGHVVGSDTANFGAWLGVGDTAHVLASPPSPAGPYGLEDARKAEIHLVIRTHGPADPAYLPAQISSFNGGCPPNTCTNVQASMHLP